MIFSTEKEWRYKVKPHLCELFQVWARLSFIFKGDSDTRRLDVDIAVGGDAEARYDTAVDLIVRPRDFRLHYGMRARVVVESILRTLIYSSFTDGAHYPLQVAVSLVLSRSGRDDVVFHKSQFTFHNLENMMVPGRDNGRSFAFARRAIILAPSVGVEDDGCAAAGSVYVALARKALRSLSAGSKGR
ncbi:hypothetical protein FA13DRAFT_860136 [Coprinellus micaceus]|uniref:Uncharacterized protein n=1 Tax=Coprinellus micaceus TaxID=71717 RepID=A0A4Y7S1F5_COPMI|nr:hypothetical protein FA13DRAFT_860136 [Coprinellus micaceus]